MSQASWDNAPADLEQPHRIRGRMALFFFWGAILLGVGFVHNFFLQRQIFLTRFSLFSDSTIHNNQTVDNAESADGDAAVSFHPDAKTGINIVSPFPGSMPVSARDFGATSLFVPDKVASQLSLSPFLDVSCPLCFTSSTALNPNVADALAATCPLPTPVPAHTTPIDPPLLWHTHNGVSRRLLPLSPQNAHLPLDPGVCRQCFVPYAPPTAAATVGAGSAEAVLETYNMCRVRASQGLAHNHNFG
mgnify:CR=1 FL=1